MDMGEGLADRQVMMEKGVEGGVTGQVWWDR